MLDQILSSARIDDEEKVGFSMQIPKTLKEKFDAYCKKNKATVTGMILSFMRYTIDKDEGKITDDEKGAVKNIPSQIKADMIELISEKLQRLSNQYDEINRSDYNTPPEILREDCDCIQKKKNDYLTARNYFLGDAK